MRKIALPLNITLAQTKGDNPLFEISLHHEIFKDNDFIGGQGKTMSEALHNAASRMLQYETETEQERMAVYLTTPHNREEMVRLAMKVGEATSWNSFNLIRLQKLKKKIFGSNIPNEELVSYLQNLILFRNCITKNNNGKITFKIVIKPADMIKHMDEEAETHLAIVEQLAAQRQFLEKQLTEQETKSAKIIPLNGQGNETVEKQQ